MIAHSGIGMRIRGLLRELGTISSKKGIEITLFGDSNLLKKQLPTEVLSHYKFESYTSGIYSIKELIGPEKLREFHLLDIPHFNAPLNYLEKSIVTVHDIIPFRMKQFHSSFLKQAYMRILFRFLQQKAAKIISVSNFTKTDLINVFGFFNDRVRTIYNGVDREVFYPTQKSESSDFLKKYSLEPEYLLSVGIGKQHKNLDFVLRSFKRLWSLGKLEKKWVIAGAEGTLPEYLKKESGGWEDQIRVLPKLELSELGLLYSRAAMLVFPSLYEGFGFPPVEAQACRCPVYSSNASVMPEILGNSAFYFHPDDSDMFETGLLELLSKPKLLKSRLDLGEKNSEKYSWKAAAQQTVEEYLETAKRIGALQTESAKKKREVLKSSSLKTIAKPGRTAEAKSKMKQGLKGSAKKFSRKK
ncbi:glycosyl transferase [Leptospira perolatii]|uniref:Glycosyl transferase n=1 Tax=Leptospira perolatii TaxID=2023191 RepID=A0A2M9ZL77_9LEPT|nr:glycosyl transferase [Leptospira perolatii]PJZ72731.1 glycosyl transferase [Leptospira perolatii]